MPMYVVERYLPALNEAGVRAQAGREAMLPGVRHVRTTYLCEDELCFSVFEAPSIATLRTANERTGLAFERITVAIDVTAEGEWACSAEA
jgi:hypothetical protein